MAFGSTRQKSATNRRVLSLRSIRTLNDTAMERSTQSREGLNIIYLNNLHANVSVYVYRRNNMYSKYGQVNDNTIYFS